MSKKVSFQGCDEEVFINQSALLRGKADGEAGRDSEKLFHFSSFLVLSLSSLIIEQAILIVNKKLENAMPPARFELTFCT